MIQYKYQGRRVSSKSQKKSQSVQIIIIFIPKVETNDQVVSCFFGAAKQWIDGRPEIINRVLRNAEFSSARSPLWQWEWKQVVS